MDLEKLKQSINQTGFPLELKVAKLFKKLGWKLMVSPYYIDKDEMKGREIDLYASNHIFGEDKNKIYFENSFGFSVEIKEAKKKPWVFFSAEESSTFFPFEYTANEKFISDLFEDKDKKVFLVNHRNKNRFKKETAKSFFEGFSKNGGRDDIYKAISGSVKAMIHFREESYPPTDKGPEYIFESFNSLVVVKGEMFEAKLDDNTDELILDKSDYVQVAFNYLSPNYKSLNKRGTKEFIVHIVEYDYLEKFLLDFYKEEEKLFCKFLKKDEGG